MLSFLNRFFQKTPRSPDKPLAQRVKDMQPAVYLDVNAPGRYAVEVVGESRSQKALEKISGPKEAHGKRHQCMAILLCEDSNPHDSSAVAVFIDRSKVGYLNRHDARAYRSKMADQTNRVPAFKVNALIVGGYKKDGEEGHYGVQLDMDPL